MSVGVRFGKGLHYRGIADATVVVWRGGSVGDACYDIDANLIFSAAPPHLSRRSSIPLSKKPYSFRKKKQKKNVGLINRMKKNPCGLLRYKKYIFLFEKNKRASFKPYCFVLEPAPSVRIKFCLNVLPQS